MKKNFFYAAIAMLLSFSVISCDSKKSKDDKSSDTPATTSSSASTDAPPAGNKGMTVSEAKDFLDADEANSGKEVTVSAYSWGYNERMDDKVQLNLGDKKLEGMQSASFSCMFGKDKLDMLKAIAKDAMVTVTGKISKGAGGVELNDCKLAQ